MIEEKEIAFCHLLAEAEEIMIGMYSNLLLSNVSMSTDWKQRITSWLDMKENV